MNERIGLWKNIAFISSAKLYEAICAITWTVVIARNLGVEGMGRYSLLWVILTLLFIIPDAGLNNVLIKELVSKEREPQHNFGTVIILRSGLFVIVCTVSLLVLNIFDVSIEMRESYYFGLLWLLGKMSLRTNYAVYLSNENLKLENILTLIESTLTLFSIVIVLSYTDMRLEGIFMSLAFATLVVAVISMFITRRWYFRPKFRVDQELTLYYLRHSAFIGGSRFLRTFYNKVDIILLSRLSTIVDVGIYSAPYNLIQRLSLSAFLVAKPLYPILSWFAKHDKAQLRILYTSAMRLLVFLSIPLVISLFSFSEEIVMFLGKDFAESSIVLRFLSIVMLFSFPNALFVFLNMALSNNKFLFRASAISLILNIIIDLMLIPGYGYIGACIGTISAEVTFFLVNLEQFKRVFGFSAYLQELILPLSASAVVTLIVFFNKSIILWSNQWVAYSLIFLSLVSFVVLLKGLFIKDVKKIKYIISLRPKGAGISP